MNDGTIVKELNYVVTVWSNDKGIIDELIRLALIIKREMQQKTVGIEYNNKFYLI